MKMREIVYPIETYTVRHCIDCGEGVFCGKVESENGVIWACRFRTAHAVGDVVRGHYEERMIMEVR